LSFHSSVSNDSILHLFLPVGKYDEVTDKENFILVAPKAALIESDGKLSWSVDRKPTEPDDVGFKSALIDSLSNRYKIDHDRIYASGYSSGAFMSFALACELSGIIAAVAGLAAYMSWSYLAVCNPSRPMAILQIHGNLDPVVPYSGVQPSLNVCIDHNKVSMVATVDIINIDFSDGSWVEQFRYPDGEQGYVGEHLKVWGGKQDYAPH